MKTKEVRGITIISLVVTIVVLLILAGAIIGNYVQQNKDDVKAKLKKFIDKM